MLASNISAYDVAVKNKKRRNMKKLPRIATFGKRLCFMRKKRGFTQQELAEKLNYKRSGSISRIENGFSPPDFQALPKIAAVLDADLHWLLTGKHSPALKNVVSLLQPFVSGLLSEMSQEIKTAQISLVDLGIGQNVMGKDNKERLEQVRSHLKSLEDRYKAVYQRVQETGFLDLDV